MTRGRPVFSSTYATRLLVVPRAMPTMRDITLRCASERLVDVVDDGSQIRPHRQGFLEGRQRPGPFGGPGRVPRLAERPAQSRFFLLVARAQPLSLGGERLPRAGVEPVRLPRLGFLERLLDLEHLLEQLGRRLRLHRGALTRLAALFEPDQIFDPRDRIAERVVRGVEARGGRENLRLALRGRALMVVGVAAARELVELPLELGGVDGESSRQLEHLEVIHALLKMRTGPPPGPFRVARGPGYAENEVPHPQLDFAWGLTKVKPPVNPCWT